MSAEDPGRAAPAARVRYRCAAASVLEAGRSVLATPAGRPSAWLSAREWGRLQRAASFATLPEHAALLGVSLEDVSAWADRGLLVPDGPVGAAPADERGALELLAIPTRNRPASVVACVRSARLSARRWGRRLHVVVIDQTDDPAAAAATRAALQAEGARVLGPADVERLAVRLARESGVDAELVRFATHRRPAALDSSVGAARNAAMLLLAGRRHLQLDDDVSLGAATTPPDRDEPRAATTPEPTQWWFYADREGAFAAHDLVDLDPIGAAERVLGAPAAELLGPSVGAPWWDETSGTLADTLRGGRAVVRALSFGQWGDTGTASPHHALHLLGPSALRARADWAVARSCRTVLRAAPGLTLTDGRRFVSAAVGFDGRVLLPPFSPLGRAADGAWGDAAVRCGPGALIAHLPVALRHDPPEVRVERDDAVHRPAALDLSELVSSAFASARWDPEAPSAERLAAVGRGLIDLSQRSDRDLADYVTQLWLTRTTRLVASLDRAREATLLTPAEVEADYDAARARLLDAPARPVVLPVGFPDRASVRRYLGDLGRLCVAWPALVDAARRLGGAP